MARKLSRLPLTTAPRGDAPTATRPAGLQAAGNRAAANVLARDGVQPWSWAAPKAPPTPGGPIIAPGALARPRLPEAVETPIRRYLAAQRSFILTRKIEGSISMPEVIDDVRRKVPEAATVDQFSIKDLALEVLGDAAPPETRAKTTPDGARKELEASFANLLPKVPDKAEIALGSDGKLSLQLIGVEASYKVSGATLTATAEKDEASAKVEKGGASAKATFNWKDESFGLETAKDNVTLSGKVEKGGDKFSVGLTVNFGGEKPQAVPPVEEMRGAVEKARQAIDAVVTHVRRGGDPKDPLVRDKLAEIKPALEVLSKATAKPPEGRPGISVSVTGSAGKEGLAAGASLVIRF